MVTGSGILRRGATPPVITVQPVAQTVTAGQPVTLSVTASGDSGLGYLWQDSTYTFSPYPLPSLSSPSRNPIASTYGINAAEPSDIGEYNVTVSDASGSVTSQTVLLAVTPAPAPQPVYSLTDLGSLGGGLSTASGMNSQGQVVGASTVASGTYHAFLYTSGAMKDLSPSDYASDFSVAVAVNSAGTAVGTVYVGKNEDDRFQFAACTFAGGSLTKLASPGEVSTPGYAAYAINDSGQIAITFADFSSGPTGTLQASFAGPGPLPTIVGNPPTTVLSSSVAGLDNAGDAVGSFNDQAYFFGEAGSQALGTLGGPTSSAAAINSSGQIVGVSDTAAGPAHAFLYSGGVMQDLGVPAGWAKTSALALNNRGQIVGDGTDSNQATRAFIYSPGIGIADLNGLVALSDGTTPGFVMLNSAAAINDSGQIAGTGLYFDGASSYTRAFLLNPLYAPITGPAANQTVNSGSTVVINVGAPGASSFQWQFDGVNLADGTSGSTTIVGSQGPVLELKGATVANAGSYTCLVTYTPSTGYPATISTGPSNLVVAAVSNPGYIVNMSARSLVGTGDATLIGGFFVGGTTSRTVLIQALGPALAGAGVSGVLQKPALTIHDSTGAVIFSNAGWGSSQVLLNAAASVYAQPVLQPNSADSEVLVTLPPGGYTAEVTGADGGTGIALCAIYELP
jgi:probable HAF family extracellular repeat protein